jgi:predicted DNA-binding transcriptional regulator AlpA
MKIIRGPKLSDAKGIDYSNEHRRRLEAQGKFPKRVRLNPSDPRGYCGYIEEEIDAWIAERAAERNDM